MEPMENIMIGKSFDTLTAERRYIFRKFRQVDESNKWPVSGKFNVTERAIQRLRRFEQQTSILSGFEVIAWLDAEISRIVNDPNL
jgi:hypothetical protein